VVILRPRGSESVEQMDRQFRSRFRVRRAAVEAYYGLQPRDGPVVEMGYELSQNLSVVTNMLVVRYSRTSLAQRNIPMKLSANLATDGWVNRHQPSAFLASFVSNSFKSTSRMSIWCY